MIYNYTYLLLRIISLRLLICISLFVFSVKCIAQCPPGLVNLSTQAEVDNFIIQYPNCTEITGDLNIDGAAGVTNLNGLRNLETVTRDLNIVRTSDLTDISGLSKIKSVGRNLWIDDNAMLSSINIFTDLESVEAWFHIGNNDQLTQIGSFNTLINCNIFDVQNNLILTTINTFPVLTTLSGNVTIANNPQLINFNSFPILTTISANLSIQNNNLLNNVNTFNALTQIGGGLKLVGNNSMNDISGLQNINPASITGDGLTIQNNPNLSVCDLDNFCTYLQGAGLRNISGNIGDCANEQAVNNKCQQPDCPPGNVFISSQAQLNNFKVLYPNCTEINGKLGIEGSSIINLDGLSNIVTIKGNLEILWNSSLENLDGLNSLSIVDGYFHLQNNEVLTNIDALSSLNSVGNYISISNHPSLINLNGLNSLTTLGAYLSITNNTELNDISGISNLDLSLIQNLNISNNSKLSVCNLPNICTYLQGTGFRTITDNAGNCVTEQAVNNACNPTDCPQGSITLATQSDVNQFLIDYPNCTEITGNLFIGIGTGTSNITNLSPLSKLATIGGYLAIYNTSATNLIGLHNLTSILVDIDIRNNALLTDISALQNTTFNPDGTFGLTIINNPALSVCNLPNFCTYLTNPAATHPRNISGNAGDCITEQAVVDACENATCIVSIPDANFKAYLVGNLAINTNGDSEIQCTEAEVYSGAILCPFQNIADLTGIETFVNITNLDCGANQLTNLNLSNNTKLTRVAAATNQLTSLNVNNCVSLQRLYCETNQLTNLNVSTNSDLIELLCVNNKLTSLDLKNNGSLTDLDCSFNRLTKLSLKNGNNTIITSVRTNSNPDLTCIEVDNATFSADNWTGGNYSFDAQHSFSEDCEDVPILEGDQCTNAVNIQTLFGHPQDEPQASQTYTTEGMTSNGNPNTGNDCLDIERKTMWLTFTGDGNRYYIRSNYCSAKVFNDPNGALYTGNCNGGLEQIDCNYWISSSDIDPDANFQFTLQTTPGQTYYILVAVSATDDFVIYDDFGNFCLEVTRLGEECLVQIPDPNFKTYLIENFDINKNGDDEIQCEEAEGYFNQIDCSQLGIANLKGIEAFIYISGLNCSGNELNSIDLSKNTFLGTLNCSNNNLSNLNLTNNIQLYDIKCFGNRISTLDVSKLEGLDELGCNDNFLVSLDVSKNTILRNLWCYSNQLVYLNVANGSNVNMTMIEANDNPDLTCVQVDDVDYSNENWTGGAFLFDPQSIFSEYCEPCISTGNISANFLITSSACTGDDVRIIEYGVLDTIPDPVTFSWDFGNGQKSIERDPIVSFNAPGTYTITLELGNTECPMKLVKDINILSCLRNPKGNAYSEVMPNPSSGPIHLKTRLPLESDAVVSIYDLNGKEIYNKKFSSVDAIDENITIEATGTYILEVRHVLGSEKMKLFVIE